MIKIDKLNKNFHNREIFRNFSLTVKTDIITALMGPSGCGKTTLLRIISNLIKPESGSIEMANGSGLSVIFQEDRLIPWLTAKKNITTIIDNIFPPDEAEAVAENLLRTFGLESFKDTLPEKLSGGMRQRVSIARALAFPSPILLMDEPFKALDSKTRRGVIDTFLKLHKASPRTTLLITHDPSEAVDTAEEIVVIKEPPVEQPSILKAPFSNPEKLKAYIEM